jgi:hypothetical protein
MTKQEMEAQIEALKAELAAAQKHGGGAIRFKVSEKGGVSVYGLQRMPVTLYGSQWERLLDKAADLQAFLKANASKLSVKTAKAPAAVEAGGLRMVTEKVS